MEQTTTFNIVQSKSYPRYWNCKQEKQQVGLQQSWPLLSDVSRNYISQLTFINFDNKNENKLLKIEVKWLRLSDPNLVNDIFNIYYKVPLKLLHCSNEDFWWLVISTQTCLGTKGKTEVTCFQCTSYYLLWHTNMLQHTGWETLI